MYTLVNRIASAFNTPLFLLKRFNKIYKTHGIVIDKVLAKQMTEDNVKAVDVLSFAISRIIIQRAVNTMSGINMPKKSFIASKNINNKTNAAGTLALCNFTLMNKYPLYNSFIYSCSYSAAIFFLSYFEEY
jgi:hypothetical protein